MSRCKLSGMKKVALLGYLALLCLILALAVDVSGQGSLSSQVLRLLARANRWTAAQTFAESATATQASSGSATDHLIVVPDATNWHLGILNTTYSTNRDSAFNLLQQNDGMGSLQVGLTAISIDPTVGVVYTSDLVLDAAVSTVSVANVGANSCGTTAASIAGKPNAFAITVGATGGTQCRVTFPDAAPTRRHCTAADETTTIAVRATYVDTTHTDFLGDFTAGDVVTALCLAR